MRITTPATLVALSLWAQVQVQGVAAAAGEGFIALPMTRLTASEAALARRQNAVQLSTAYDGNPFMVDGTAPSSMT